MNDDMKYFLNEYEDAVAECAVKFSKDNYDKADVKRMFDDFLNTEFNDRSKTYVKQFQEKRSNLLNQMFEWANSFLQPRKEFQSISGSKGYIDDDVFFSMWGNKFFLQPNNVDEYEKKDPDWMTNNVIQVASPRFLEIMKNQGILVGGKRKTKRRNYRKNKRSKTKRRNNKKSKRRFK